MEWCRECRDVCSLEPRWRPEARQRPNVLGRMMSKLISRYAKSLQCLMQSAMNVCRRISVKPSWIINDIDLSIRVKLS